MTWFGYCWALRHWRPRDFWLRFQFSDSRSLRLRTPSKCVAAPLNSGSTLSAHEHWARLNTWQFFQETRPSAHCENSWQKADDPLGDALTGPIWCMRTSKQPSDLNLMVEQSQCRAVSGTRYNEGWFLVLCAWWKQENIRSNTLILDYVSLNFETRPMPRRPVCSFWWFLCWFAQSLSVQTFGGWGLWERGLNFAMIHKSDGM